MFDSWCRHQFEAPVFRGFFIAWQLGPILRVSNILSFSSLTARLPGSSNLVSNGAIGDTYTLFGKVCVPHVSWHVSQVRLMVPAPIRSRCFQGLFYCQLNYFARTPGLSNITLAVTLSPACLPIEAVTRTVTSVCPTYSVGCTVLDIVIQSPGGYYFSK